MKKVVMFAMLALVTACQKHDDPSTTSTSTTASASASAISTASATPLATIEPMMTASALPTIAPSAAATGSSAEDKRRAELAKQAEQMQLQMLQALGNSHGQSSEGVLSKQDDFAAMLADAGAGLRVGSDGPIRPGHRGGLADLGTRDH